MMFTPIVVLISELSGPIRML